MLDLSSRKVYGALAEQCVGGDAKADKVENATSGHLAGLDANGNLTDSGVSPTEDVTVEGNPVEFESPFEQDAKSVVVSVKPIQDLHGYDHPWPAGGGKNKLPLVLADIKAANTSGTWSGNAYTHNGITYTMLVDNANNVTGFSISGTATNDGSGFDLIKNDASYPFNGTYIISGVDGFGDYVAVADIKFTDSSYNTLVYSSDVEKAISSNLTQYGLFIWPGITVNKTIYPMIRLATETDATFAPYSNECPISGIDEVEILRTGKNLCGNWKDNTVIIYADGSFYPQNGYKTCDFIRVSQGQKIYIQSNSIGGEKWWYNKDKTPYEWVGNGVGVKISPIDGYFAMSVLDANASTTMVEYGESGSEYEPYKGSTTTIPLPSTLYDADVDVTEGSGNSRFGLVVFDGSDDEEWGGGSSPWSNIMYIEIPGSKANGTPIANSMFGVSPRIYSDLHVGEFAHVVENDSSYFNFYTTFTSLSDWKAYLAEHPLQVCYELATPTTLSFDPTDIELLEGTNVVSTNGEKVAVKYGRSLWQDIDDLKTDTEGKLDKSDVADVEGDTASKAYSVNEFMLRSDGFYKVTQPIAQNASITSSNTTKTTIGAVLTALLNA